MKRISLVVDGLKDGRVKIRVLPEMAGTEEKDLPYALVFPHNTSGVDLKDGYPYIWCEPKIGSLIVVDINDTWTRFEFHGEVAIDEGQNLFTNNDKTGIGDVMEKSPLSDVLSSDDKKYQTVLANKISKSQVLFTNREKSEIGYFRIDENKAVEYAVITSGGKIMWYRKDNKERKIEIDGASNKITVTGFDTIEVNGDNLTYLKPVTDILKALISHVHMTSNGPSGKPIDSSRGDLSATYNDTWFKSLGTKENK